MKTFLTILIVILVILIAALVALYFFGRKMETKQVESQAAMEAAKQTVSMLIIDKKKLKIKESGLPKIVYEQTPWYLKWTKVPIVKAKVGPKIMTLMADEKIFAMIPLKTEVKAVVSGIYISDIKSVKGGKLIKPEPMKKGFFAKLFKK